MAEFKDVIKWQKRMCDAMENCGQCPLIDADCACRFSCMTEGDFDSAETEMIERIVMDWAKANPEPKYPSWNEAWKQLFPEASDTTSPCPRHFLGNVRAVSLCEGASCNECKNTPISADIAEKLGVKPIGGANDENA